MKHKEIEHLAVIDDNDANDLKILKDYLVETIKDNQEYGLAEEHIDKIAKKLKLPNKFNSIRM